MFFSYAIITPTTAELYVEADKLTPEVIAQLQAEGSTPVGGSIESATKYLKAEHTLWGGIVRSIGIKPDQ